MKHRCSGCQRVFRIVGYEPGKDVLCDACGGRLLTMHDGADPRLVHNRDLDSFAPEDLLGLSIGPFRAIQVLGAGGTGAVYLALRAGSEEEFALKILHPQLAVDKRAVHRFLREGRTIGRLEHPNLPALLGSGEVETPLGTLPYLATDYAPGGSLVERTDEGPMEPLAAIRIAREVASGLLAAHEAGVVHRDVKPGNVLLDAEGRARLTDFGLARVDGSVVLTATRAVLGTPYYIAPEQVAEGTIDGRTDIYSLGATLYHLIVGQPPFTGRLLHVLRSHGSEDPIPPGQRREGLPAGLDDVVLRMLAKKADDRYPSCRELIEDLDSLLEGRSPTIARELARRARAEAEAGPRPRYLAVWFEGQSRRVRGLLASSSVVWLLALVWVRPHEATRPAELEVYLAWLLTVAGGAAFLAGLARGRSGRAPLATLLALGGAILALDGVRRGGQPFHAVAALPSIGLAVWRVSHSLRSRFLFARSGKVRLVVGDRFPDFRLLDHDGYPVDGEELLGKKVLYVVGCGDDCSFCLVEIGELGRRRRLLSDAGVRVVAVNRLEPPDNRRLRHRLGIDIPVLSDGEDDLLSTIGVAGRDRVRPVLILVDEQGIVRWVDQPLDRRVRRSVESILEAIRGAA